MRHALRTGGTPRPTPAGAPKSFDWPGGGRGKGRPTVRDLLFPDYAKFFASFNGVASAVSAAARMLEQGFADPSKWHQLSIQIQRIEHEADAAARAVYVGGRSDVHPTAGPRGYSSTGRRAVSLRATELSTEAVQLARILVRATEELEAAAGHIRDRKQVLERCRTVKQCEEEGDTVWVRALTALFEGNTAPLDVLRWKTLYDQLENA